MHKKEKVIQSILEQKLLPLYYHESAEVSCNILKALYEAGIRVVEYTNRGVNAFENFINLRKTADKEMNDLLLGIGTIKNKKQAKKYIEAGADFIIAPCIIEEVGELCEEKKIMWIPGCMTPTEIATAEKAGASLVKIFPGSVLGPSYIKAIKEVFPDLRFIVTGGVEPEHNNLRSWFQNGAVAIGMGSKLISKELIAEHNYEGLKFATLKALQMVKGAVKG